MMLGVSHTDSWSVIHRCLECHTPMVGVSHTYSWRVIHRWLECHTPMVGVTEPPSPVVPALFQRCSSVVPAYRTTIETKAHPPPQRIRDRTSSLHRTRGRRTSSLHCRRGIAPPGNPPEKGGRSPAPEEASPHRTSSLHRRRGHRTSSLHCRRGIAPPGNPPEKGGRSPPPEEARRPLPCVATFSRVL